MALPKLSIPTYELTLPSNGMKLNYRPFLVKEEKLLLMTSDAEGSDDKGITEAVKQVVVNCVLTEIDINTIAVYDLEYIFLQLRSTSIGESSELRYICQNKVKHKKTETSCGSPIKVTIRLSDVTVIKDEKHDPHVKLVGDIGIVLKDPTVQLLNKYSMEDLATGGDMFNLILDCVDYVYQGDQTFKGVDCPREELDEFLGNLTQQQFEGIKTFFETLPRLEHNVELNCPKCKNKSTMPLHGLSDFFM